MSAAPPLPSDVLASLPPAVVALIAWPSEPIRLLTARVAELEGQLNPNSSHSSKPPSADPPSAKPAPARTPSGKKRGGPPGHPKHERTILPPDESHDHKPSPGGGGRRPLTGDDPQPLLEPVVDLPEKRRQVIPHRRPTLTCPDGRATTTAAAPPETRTGFGPTLQAVTAYLSGVGRMGKRPIRQFCDDVPGIPLSPGSVSHLEASTARAPAPIPAGARSAIAGRDANVDETGGKHGRKKAWRWAAVTQRWSVFLIHRNRSRGAFESLMGPSLGVRTTDRFSVDDHLPADRRQVCRAHWRRDIQARIDRNNAGRGVGEEWLGHAQILVDHGQRVRDGTRTRRGFRGRYRSWLRPEVAGLRRSGAACGGARTAAVCVGLLALEESRWTFARVAGVEPTNHAAERAVRHAVCGRKTRYGTDRERGRRFAERILTVVASGRQQKGNILRFRTEAIRSHRHGTERPSLIPTGV